VLGGEAAADDKDIMTVRVNVQIIEGPDTGRKVTYEDRVNNKSAKYIAQSARAVGWKGTRLETFRSDVDGWIKATGGESTVEIRHLEIKTGKKAGQIWGKANSIGRGPKPLKAPSRQSADEADEAMRAALAEGAGYDDSGTPPQDDIPPPGEDDIPFITNARDLTPIAKVLR
jgi:hypothetical protein